MEMYTKQKLLFDQQANEHEILLAELKKLQITIDRKEKEMNKQMSKISSKWCQKFIPNMNMIQ